MSIKTDFFPDITVNEAEYKGALLALALALDAQIGSIILCGDSNLVIRQLGGEMDCKAPALQVLHQQATDMLKQFNSFSLVHVKRDWNKPADLLATQALQREAGTTDLLEEQRRDLETLNRLPEILGPHASYSAQFDGGEGDGDIHRIRAVTRSRRQNLRSPDPREIPVEQIRADRIRQGQDEEKWIAQIKWFLRGDLDKLTKEEATNCAKISDQFD
jgi:ribonuclease HI